jgi:hypothetical protein
MVKFEALEACVNGVYLFDKVTRHFTVFDIARLLGFVISVFRVPQKNFSINRVFSWYRLKRAYQSKQLSLFEKEAMNVLI